MAPQRNNVTGLAPELRQLCSRLLYENCGRNYARIRAAMKAAGCEVELWDGTLAAWQKGDEYLRYRSAREKIENAAIRATAQAINDGQGPRDYADVAVHEVVRQLAERMLSGEISELGDLGAVTKALAPLLRAQIAADAQNLRRRIAALEDDLKAATASSQAALAAKDAEIARLRDELARLRNDGREVDPRAVADKMDEVLGVKKG
jgi:hypothetical protein